MFLLRVIHSTHYFALLQEIVAQAGDNIAEAAHVPHFVMKQNFRKPLDDIFIIGCVITGMKPAEKQKPIIKPKVNAEKKETEEDIQERKAEQLAREIEENAEKRARKVFEEEEEGKEDDVSDQMS